MLERGEGVMITFVIEVYIQNVAQKKIVFSSEQPLSLLLIYVPRVIFNTLPFKGTRTVQLFYFLHTFLMFADHIQE